MVNQFFIMKAHLSLLTKEVNKQRRIVKRNLVLDSRTIRYGLLSLYTDRWIQKYAYRCVYTFVIRHTSIF